MKINPNYKVRTVAGENIVLLQGKMGGEMTRVVAFNDSALFLWNQLQGKDFSIADAAKTLMEHYEVAESTAIDDVVKWIQVLRENGLMLEP